MQTGQITVLLFAGIIMFAVIGGISLLAHYYTLNGIKSRTVGDGQHGTARFATEKEIRKPMPMSRMSRKSGAEGKTCLTCRGWW